MEALRNITVTMTFDRGSLDLLDVLVKENEGNRSLTVRRLIREAAKERGLQAEGPKPERKGK